MSMTVTVSSSARPYSHSRSMEELANDLFVVSPSATRHAKGSQAPAQVVDPNQTRRAPQERETQLESDPDTDSTLADGTESQAEQLMVHYAQLIGQKWACPAPGHNICVVSADVDGSWVHFQLSDDNISSWVEALCIGTATPSEPPPDVLASFLSSTDIDTASISSRSTIRPPSQTHTRAASSSTASIISVWVGALGSSTYSPSSSSSGSTIRPFPSPTSTIAAPHSSTPTIRAHPSRTPSAPPRSSWSPYSSFLPSLAESSPSQANRQGVPSSRDALKKIGKGGLGTLQATKRGHTHLSCIKKWEKKAANKLGPGERARVREMLDDALEMCRWVMVLSLFSVCFLKLLSLPYSRHF
ncbi:hypothetical protein K439DRAFT_410420 [Ramaria rubella]|nr:hypothetical protein K439DRAFT_410420 [Ramaria rubella]